MECKTHTFGASFEKKNLLNVPSTPMLFSRVRVSKAPFGGIHTE